MRAEGIAVHPTGIEHGTLTVVADHRPFEVTTLRRDVETDGRRAVVAFTTDWSEDAQRRDFRMNALYVDREGAVHDPTGGGLDDVAARRIVFVGDPDTRIREDYLRILRFFRFQAWYAREAPDAAGLEACGRLRAGLAGISAERIWMETKKLLAAPQPMPSLRAMEASGVLAQLFPEAKGLDLLAEVDRARMAMFEQKFFRLTGDAGKSADLAALFYLAIVGSHQALSRPINPPQASAYLMGIVTHYLIHQQAPTKLASAPAAKTRASRRRPG